MNKTLTKIAVTGASTVLGATAALSLSMPAQAATLKGEAQGCNVFVFGNMTASSDAEGRVCVSGNAILDLSVGTKLSPGSGDVLVVGGDLTYASGNQISGGDAIVGGTANLSPGLNIKDGELKLEEPSIDFDAAEQFYKNYSAQLGGLNANGETNVAYNNITLGGVGSGRNVFNLDASDLSNASSLNITNVNADSTILVNVIGDSISAKNFQIMFDGTADKSFASNVLWNLPDATYLTSEGFSWIGSVLAPMAHYDFNNGHIDGQLITQSVSGSGEYHNIGFDGDLPEPESVPEPLTILGSGMALGFGAFFKRQQSKKQKNAN
ncbi:MAG: PEP-CTERM sorting domain-containing protein [Coleofasciculus sp. A1-SPW-01]|uniref:PEP-CTERM sorting domain-containing protein n=1 Tax=Coleofasciculus sp. A1-SPW-01 TaxID=3070819 RepID=UPI0032F65E57